MINFPNFFLFLKKIIEQIDNKTRKFKEFFLSAFVLLFFGLFSGSLFGTFLDLPRSSGFWDGLVVLLLLFMCELINLFVYTYQLRFFKFLNYFKIGLLLALFIDAFKVGS